MEEEEISGVSDVVAFSVCLRLPALATTKGPNSLVTTSSPL